MTHTVRSVRSKAFTGLFGIAGLLGAAGLAGCSSSDGSSESSASVVSAGITTTVAAAQTTVAAPDTTASAVEPTPVDGVQIKDFTFTAFTASVGETFTITNADTAAHTYSAVDGTFEAAVGSGKTVELSVAKAGTYEVFCEIHPNMSGVLTIE